MLKTVTAVLLTSVATSCIYDSLPPCPDGGKIDITIVNDWKKSPDAAPEGMAYLFYRKDTANPWRFDFPGKTAGKISLEPGEYEFVMYNNDTADVSFSSGSGGMPVVSMFPEKLRVGEVDMDVYESPDLMWSAYIGGIKVDARGVEYRAPHGVAPGNDPYMLVDEPVQITPAYSVRVLHVENLHGVRSVKGVLSGMSSEIELFGSVESEKTVCIAFDAEVEKDSTLKADFYTFGLPEGRRETNELQLYFLLSDGRIEKRTYDETQTVTHAPDPMHVRIVVDSVQLPYARPWIGGGAFDPVVAGWTTVVLNY